jgi:hypothetical protein
MRSQSTLLAGHHRYKVRRCVGQRRWNILDAGKQRRGLLSACSIELNGARTWVSLRRARVPPPLHSRRPCVLLSQPDLERLSTGMGSSACGPGHSCTATRYAHRRPNVTRSSSNALLYSGRPPTFSNTEQLIDVRPPLNIGCSLLTQRVLDNWAWIEGSPAHS